MNINASIIFEKNFNALANDKRNIVNQGSSRSSKTYSICQMLIIYSLRNKKKVISIVRKTFPTLRATCMRDFFEILKGMGLYDRKSHNKTENIYTFPNGTIIEFFSTDDEQKLRGRKRDIC
jgi:phage terminase large subunit